MFRHVFDFIKRRQAKSFLEGVRGWYQTCNQISAELGKALDDREVTHQDIGAIIDKADRLLINLGNYIPETKGLLRRRDPQLAERIEMASRQVVQLRNEAARFLIRSQGPSPMAENHSADFMRQLYYYRALEEAGFKAREIKHRFDRDLQAIWKELQVIIIQTERMLVNHT